jgi:hypothetical protein
MSLSVFEKLGSEELEMVIGGISLPGGAQQQQQQQDNRPWVDRLTDNLRSRGFDPSIDPGMERKPPSADMDPGIMRQLGSGGGQRDI